MVDLVLNVCLAIVCLLLLRRAGSTTVDASTPLIGALGLVLVVCLVYDVQPFTWFNFTVTAAAFLGFWWLLTPASVGGLATVSVRF
jgi:hypothetical protein